MCSMFAIIILQMDTFSSKLMSKKHIFMPSATNIYYYHLLLLLLFGNIDSGGVRMGGYWTLFLVGGSSLISVTRVLSTRVLIGWVLSVKGFFQVLNGHTFFKSFTT